MKKSVILLILCSLALIARDNPFKPVVSNSSMGKATNVDNGYKPLKIEKFKLPSSSRVIKNVKFEILNVDGSISEASFAIDKKVDWHQDIILSNMPIVTANKPKKIEPKLLKPFKFLSVLIDKNKLLLKTNDPLIRELFFAKPYKIAIDLKRDVSFYTKIIKLKNLPFVKVVIGNHGKFYRVVMQLDGKYRYKIKKNSNGYLVELF
jgi:hypothetical protein